VDERDTAGVGEGNRKLVEQLYGFDWIGLASREEGLTALGRLMDPGFTARVSPEVGDRELEGIDGMVNFVQALEEDFEEFRYLADEIDEVADDRVVVSGWIAARGRASRMPLTSEFGHVWSVADGKVRRVEAYLDRAAAEEAAAV
jgi:ketosteroid isomerase-like protein